MAKVAEHRNKPASGPLGIDGVERFDVLPLLVATDGAIAAFGHDYRRLRPNILIGGVEGLAERQWPGGCLRIGKVLIGVQDLRLRCIMTLGAGAAVIPGITIQAKKTMITSFQ